jgi:ketosteroid isomerase-like protein
MERAMSDPHPATEDAASAVQAMIGPWSRACIERDWDTLLEMCTEDVVFLPPGGEPVSGPALMPWLEEFPPIRSMDWSLAEAHQNGDLATIRGPVEQVLVLEGREVTLTGNYVDVLRRGDGRSWRFQWIIWNAIPEGES